MKRHKNVRNVLCGMAFVSLWGSGCGSSATANQVVVSVSGTASVLVPTQTQTITSTVTGATDVSSAFDCTYTTTPNPTTTTPSPTPSAAAECTSANGAVGVLSNIQNTSTTVASTATFTAPSVFPDQTKLPNVIVTITATSNADKKKTGKFSFVFDSGIRITLSPATATLGTGEAQLFLAEDLNGNVITPDQLTWRVTFESSARTSSADCSTGSNGCGSIDKTGLYTAPPAVPTAAPGSTTTPVNPAGIVTVFAFSNVDNARISQSAVTIVQAGNITFSGISPAVVPQGALQQDIFLAATNATSQIGVKLTAPCGDIPIDPQSQIKVVFAPGTTASSIGARIRLKNVQLTVAGHYQVQVTSSNPSITVSGGPFPLDIIPVRPTIVGSNPENLEQSTLGQNGITIDGGYFGTNVGTLPTCPVSPTITPLFNNMAPSKPYSVSTARSITGLLPNPSASTPTAGLFPLSVKYSTSPGPFAAPASTTAYTNIAVIPDYAASNPPGAPAQLTLPAASVPSAIALDSKLGYAVVTLAGANSFQNAAPTVNTSNNLQFINLAGGSPSLANLVSTQGFVATGVAVDDQLHVAAVVNYASRSLSVLSTPAGTSLATIDLSAVIPQPVPADPTFVEPFPYSVGIDPFAHRALVAFASTNVGLVINLDPSVTPTCLAIAPQATYCPIGYVTLGSGTNPQVAFEPGARLTYATPGGAGLLSAVDLANPANPSVAISSATRASNIVTVTTSASHNLNPGNPGTVLISGLPAGSTSKTNFNGSFSVGTVLDATHFQYFQADKDDTSTCATVCVASSGVPFLTYTISPSTVGMAFNSVTRRAVLADPNATFGQITFLDPQSESVSSMTLFKGATGAVNSGAPELGAATVAFQPFTNTAVSFNSNSQFNQVSLIDPSALQRLAIIPTTQTGTGTASFTPSGATTALTVTIPGALAVDSIHNLAMAVNSGSGSISLIQLGKTIKSIHIESVQSNPVDDPTRISVPANLSPAVKITSGMAPTPVGGVRIFGVGFDSGSQVRLDGVPFASSTLGNFTLVNSSEIDVTIPVSTPDPTSPGGTLNILAGPRHFALDVLDSSGNDSNVSDFTVLEEIPLAPCNVTTATPNGTAAAPGGVAIDEINNLAVVTNTGSGCNQVSVFSLNPANILNPGVKTIATGDTPTAIAVLPRLNYTGQATSTSGVAVVTNNGSNSVSVLDLVNAVPVPDASGKAITVSVGTAPSGVAIDQETNLVVVANTSSNTVSTIDLTPLTASPIGALSPVSVAVDQNPIAVAIDPDRGTNGRGLAVVTCLVLNGAAPPSGTLDGVDIGLAVPAKSTSASTSFLTSTPTGVVFDPSVSPALFYAVSTQGNVITSFNPDADTTQTIKVGISPNAIAYNFQTGTILTLNSLSKTISIVDSQTFATKATLGIGATSKFAAAIQTFTNLAVIADHDNNRVILFPLPK